jgi:hypothetical protein
MNLSVDIRHWLDEDGEPAEPVRRKALWIARMIEYGGRTYPWKLQALTARTTRHHRRLASSPLEGAHRLAT